ncbi:MAG: hypothetical protein WCB00_22990 [Candidatus Acidiferrales bacterium]
MSLFVFRLRVQRENTAKLLRSFLRKKDTYPAQAEDGDGGEKL